MLCRTRFRELAPGCRWPSPRGTLVVALIVGLLLGPVATGPVSGADGRGARRPSEALSTAAPAPDRLAWTGQRGIVAAATWTDGRQRFAPLVDPDWPNGTGTGAGRPDGRLLPPAAAPAYLLARGPHAVRAPPAG